jgi:hypothetical protein
MLPERQFITRKTLQRELVLNAATKPVAVAVAASVAVAALVLGTPWLLPVAVAIYAALVLTTLFDAKEVERVARKAYGRDATKPGRPATARALAPEVSSLVERAHVEEARIRRAIADSGLPFTDVAVEVEYLLSDLERNAQRANTLLAYLGEQRPFQLQRQLQALRAGGSDDPSAPSRDRAAAAVEHQLAVGEQLRSEYGRFTAEIEHVVASLGAIHGELVRITVAEDAFARESVAEQVRELRRRVTAVAEGMDEAVVELDPPPEP